MFKPRRDNFSDKRKGSGRFGGGSRDRFGKGGDRPFSGGFDRGFDRDREDRVSFDAICDQCGKACTVPFKPTGSRPVLCRNCFRKDGGGSSYDRPSFRDRGDDRDSRRGGSDSRSGGNEGLERQMKAINQKLDLILDALAPEEPKKKKKADKKKKKQEEVKEVIEEEMADDDMLDDDDDMDDDEEDFEDDAIDNQDEETT
jgi:CxxC-x17-CxxC domain-containing protein